MQQNCLCFWSDQAWVQLEKRCKGNAAGPLIYRKFTHREITLGEQHPLETSKVRLEYEQGSAIGKVIGDEGERESGENWTSMKRGKLGAFFCQNSGLGTPFCSA